ncbi:MAG TPA: serine hydrolase domain-containing protein [Bosea sp. (in: a-proteobacteria)]|jgi:D-alanyl-D-alanine carboxypeptidase|uniref:serine hydrolase domain-containing protein n=1 Tax=Bosea sp. (in: a-proteobacteria) TaxID=1871050 RepID=UPI002E0E4D5A|nr:serine hydrolase domain-containing protein [Bosea sp. (in: a-proteobacteria)]
MTTWLAPALDYVSSWLAFQHQHHLQPGVAIAVTQGDRLMLEAAFGQADRATGEALTPRHGFRIASHSKSFTAAGLLKLAEAGRLRLDDAVGTYVPGLHPEIAAATLRQIVSNSAGLTRDGPDSGQFTDRRPYLDKATLLADLSAPPPLPASQRFKYSNHGFALLGLVIEAVTERPYAEWIAQEVVAAAGLLETTPGIEGWGARPMAKGHSGRQPLDRRIVIPADNPGHAMDAAAGFVATAADVARYFAQLAPTASTSILSPLSRREMSRRHWADDESVLGRHYGLGTISGGRGGWRWFGHSGGFQGFITRTAVFPEQDLTVSVLTNAIDGLAHPWLDGVVSILRRFKEEGPASADRADWSGRWWTLWGCNDLVAMSGKVLVANPALLEPFQDAPEIAFETQDTGRIARASGFSSPGETVTLNRGADGRVESVRLGGGLLVAKEALQAEMTERYLNS